MGSECRQRIEYRPEIDGLRAFAVLSVIVHHLDSRWLQGGYVGVDVFFVISGYLITTIIRREMSGGRFSLFSFYARRMKRILPLLFTVIVATLGAGYFLYFPPHMEAAANSSIASIFSLANIRFAMVDGGYFALPSSFLPLLHTWSLSVEEQYYFIYPLILWGVFGKGVSSGSVKGGILVCACLSVAAASLMGRDPALAQWSYYLLPTRALGLLVGCYLGLGRGVASGRAARNLLSVAGVSALVLAVTTFDRATPFPGVSSLLPCLGAGCVILGGRDSWAGRILALRGVVFIGLISYSLYMWHWPVLATMRIISESERLSLPFIGMAVLLTGVASVLSWRFIEQPFRCMRFSFWGTAVRYAILPAVVLVGVCLFIRQADGLEGRFADLDPGSRKVTTFDYLYNEDMAEYNAQARPLLKDVGSVGIVLTGDSHAMHFTDFLHALPVMQKPEIRFVSLAVSGLPAAQDVEDSMVDNPAFATKLRKLESRVVERADVVFIASRYEFFICDTTPNPEHCSQTYLYELESFVSRLVEKGKKVVLLGQIPKFEVSHANYLRYRERYPWWPVLNDRLDPDYREANVRVRRLADASDHVLYVDFDSTLCSDGECARRQGGVMLYKDSNHLSATGASLLAEQFVRSDEYERLQSFLLNKIWQ